MTTEVVDGIQDSNSEDTKVSTGISQQEYLVPQQKYLEAGIHIGTKIKFVNKNWFVYKEREDGLYVLDIKKIDERLKILVKVLSRYKPEEIVITASRHYSSIAAKTFSRLTGIRVLTGRYLPGTISNLQSANRVEPKLMFICDPKGERQAVLEAGKHGIFTVGLVDTDNTMEYLDLVVPCNNKGKKSLSLIFWILAREYMFARGSIKSRDDFAVDIKEFESSASPSVQSVQQS
ncbi:MAG: 30S ribosomal protein S2 [Candidatus Micrarchaeota archaeon]|nr:30S ribosomal protein S2 [Candidatus Micrarchaeota archaeon]